MKGDTLHQNNVSFSCGTGSPYYMENVAFCNLIKHLTKDVTFAKMPRHKTSCDKDFSSVHMQTLAFKCIPEFEDENLIADL